MAKRHGKNTYFALDDLGGSLTAIRANCTGLDQSDTVDIPDTTTYGERGMRRELVGHRGKGFNVSGFFKQSASKVHGKNTRVLVGGFSTSGWLESTTVNRSAAVPPTETYGDDWRERDLKGQLDASFSFSGQYGGAAGELYAVFKGLIGQLPTTPLSVAPSGFALGNLVDMGAPAISELPLNTPLTDKATLSVTAPCDGESDLGVSLHDLTAETTTFDGTSVDESAATANGGVGHIHVTAFTGTSGTFKIQHSSDNSNWTDLITFASVTGIGSERVVLAAGTAVNRYVRAQCSADNFTTATLVIVFGRRDFAYGTAGTHRHFVGLVPKDPSSTFEYGPDGNVAGQPKITGECVCTAYNVTYPHNGPSTFSATFETTGAVTDNTTF